MKKRLITVLMMLGLVMSLAACGQESEKLDTGKESYKDNVNTNDKDSGINGDETNTEDASNTEDVKKEPGILKSKTEKPTGGYIRYYEYDKNGYEIKIISTHNQTGDIISHVERVYDEKGNLLEENPIVSQNTSDSRIGYEYDEYGNLLNQFYIGEDGQKGSVFREYVYIYDEHNNMISETTIDKRNSTETTYTTEITYDENGRITLAIKKNERGKFVNRLEWSYYEDGTVKQYIEKGSFGDTITDYDEAGRKIKETKGSEIQEWEYSAEGYLLSEKTYNDEVGEYSEYKYVYDANGNLQTQQTISNREGEVYCALQYEYNESGKLLKMTFLRGGKYVSYYTTYEYDENDNLIKECEQDDNGIFSVIEYTYYE